MRSEEEIIERRPSEYLTTPRDLPLTAGVECPKEFSEVPRRLGKGQGAAQTRTRTAVAAPCQIPRAFLGAVALTRAARTRLLQQRRPKTRKKVGSAKKSRPLLRNVQGAAEAPIKATAGTLGGRSCCAHSMQTSRSVGHVRSRWAPSPFMRLASSDGCMRRAKV